MKLSLVITYLLFWSLYVVSKSRSISYAFVDPTQCRLLRGDLRLEILDLAGGVVLNGGGGASGGSNKYKYKGEYNDKYKLCITEHMMMFLMMGKGNTSMILSAKGIQRGLIKGSLYIRCHF